MFVRGFSLIGCLCLAVASVAQAGVAVTLVPKTPGPYAQGEKVLVDVMINQDPVGADRLLRFAQLDFNARDSALTLRQPLSHNKGTLITGDDINFWNFGTVACGDVPPVLSECGTPACAALLSECGSTHFIIDRGSLFLPPGDGIISITFGSDGSDPAAVLLGESLNLQIMLPGDGSMYRIGTTEVTMPGADGTYTLDVLNAAETHPDKGGQFRWGFGLVGGDPITVWRASAGDVTGGTLDMVVGTVTTPSTVQKWESSNPHAPRVAEARIDLGQSPTEPRFLGLNKVVVTFDNPIDPASATAANVSVSGCGLGDVAVDLTGTTVTVSTAASDTELVIEFSPKLPNVGRYLMDVSAVLGGNGAAVAGATTQIAYALLGDATGDRRVTAQDVGGVRSFVGLDPIDPNVAFNVRSDATNDGRITAQDVGGVRSQVGTDARSITCP